jgi:hypothetical protein
MIHLAQTKLDWPKPKPYPSLFFFKRVFIPLFYSLTLASSNGAATLLLKYLSLSLSHQSQTSTFINLSQISNINLRQFNFYEIHLSLYFVVVPCCVSLFLFYFILCSISFVSLFFILCFVSLFYFVFSN